MADKDAFYLIFTPEVSVGGQAITGSIILNTPLLRLYKYEEVHVNLRGELVTRIGPHKEEVHLVHDTIGIWKRCDAAEVEKSSQHVRRKTWTFNLPQSRAPSGTYEQESWRGTWYASATYYVEAIGVRLNAEGQRIRRQFTYVPSSTIGSQMRDALVQGWSRRWKTIEDTQLLCPGSSWKDLSEAKTVVSLELPDVEGFPIDTPIPLILNVTMLATPKKLHSAPTSRVTQLLGVDVTLVRDVFVKARLKETFIQKEFVARIGSFGTLVGKKNLEHRLEAKEMPWMPILDDEEEHTGVWREEYEMASKFVLTCPPSTHESTLRVAYFMQMKIAFDTGPDTVTRIPLEIVSSRCVNCEAGPSESSASGNSVVQPGHSESTASENSVVQPGPSESSASENSVVQPGLSEPERNLSRRQSDPRPLPLSLSTVAVLIVMLIFIACIGIILLQVSVLFLFG